MKLPWGRDRGRDPSEGASTPRDGDTAPVARDLRALGAALSPDDAFVRDLEGRLRRAAAGGMTPARPAPAAQPSSRPRRWWRGTDSRARQVAAVAAVALLVLGGGFWASPDARAGAARLACLIPGLGIRDCAAPGLVATGPVAAARDGATLTVTHLLSSGGQTTVRLEIAGLTFPASPPGMGDVRVTLRDTGGRTYVRADALREGAMRSGGAVRAPDGAGTVFVREETLAPLDPGVRAVDLLVEGPAPIGSWRVRVPLLPVDEARLRAATPGPGGVARHGITLRVAGVAADDRGLAVQLAAQMDPTTGVVRAIGGPRFGRGLVLRDERGRAYPERPGSSAQAPSDTTGVYYADAAFDTPPPGARVATLTVPFVTVEEAGGEATLRVPLAGRRVGDRIPLDREVAIGPYRFRVTEISLAEDNRGEPRLWLTLDLGDWAGGRKLVSPGRVAIDGDEGAWRGASACGGDVGQCARLAVALPRRAGDEVVVAFRNPVVAVAGPWELEVPLPAGR